MIANISNKASDFIIEVLSKGKSKDKKFLFICGKGSNGLDGIYSCYKLKKLGYQVNIISLDERNISYLEKFEIKNNLIKDFKSDDFDCIVDCIFGYGFNRDLNSSYIKLINKINFQDHLYILLMYQPVFIQIPGSYVL